MKIFISQPMSGKSNDRIRQERQKVIEELGLERTLLHVEIIDSIIEEEAPQNTDKPIYYLAKSIELLAQADLIIFMQGWEEARGCRIEHQIAVEYKKDILYCNKKGVF